MSENELVTHIELYDNQVFQNCSCREEEKTQYSIEHSKKPLPLPRKLIEAIEMLLWYSPNNESSAQSFDNSYLQNRIFDKAVLTYYLRFMKMEAKDVLFVTGSSIEPALVNPFIGATCHKCQKMIFAQKPDETKLSCILRHLRNCLAHGRFNFLPDGQFIGFDRNGIKYTAVIKSKIEAIHAFCEQLIHFPDFTISHILQYIFMKHGYTVLSTVTGGYNYRDNANMEELVFAIKDDNAIRFNCSRYQKNKKVEDVEIIKEYKIVLDEQFNESVEYVNVFYCENELSYIRQLGKNMYVIGLAGLERVFTDASIDFRDLFEKS